MPVRRGSIPKPMVPTILMKTSKKLKLPAIKGKFSASVSKEGSMEERSNFAPHSYLQEIIRRHYVAFAWQTQLKKIEGSFVDFGVDSAESK